MTHISELIDNNIIVFLDGFGFCSEEKERLLEEWQEMKKDINILNKNKK